MFRIVHSTCSLVNGVVRAAASAKSRKPGGWAFPVVALLPVAVMLIACTPGSFEQPSSGWSPAAAAVVPVKSGETVNEGAPFSNVDDTLTVSYAVGFAVGQTIQIGTEQMTITAIRDRDLRVVRGVNGTWPQVHADLSDIYKLGEEWVVFITTKQGQVTALRDDGSPSPPVKWTFAPEERDR